MSVLKRNILFLLVSQGATWLVTIFLLILGPRKLGSDGFGRAQFALAFVGFFNLIGSLGTYQYIVKHIARDPAELGRLVISALRLKMVMGVVLAALALGTGWLLGYDGEVLTLIAIGLVGMMLSLLNEMVLAGLAGVELIAGSAVWQTVQVYVGSILAIVVLLTTKSLYAYLACFSLALAVPLVANFLTLRPHLRHVARRSPVTWRVLIVGGIPMFALAALSLLYSTIDIPIVEAVSGDEVVGWYTLAYRWVLMPIFINTIVATAFLPQMSALAATAPERFCALTNRAIKMVMAITIPGAVGILLISSDLIDLLYGPAYEQSVVLMQLLAPFVPLVALNTVLGTALVASDRHHRYIWVAAAAAVFNPPIAFLAIRLANDRYDGNGYIGAAIVTVLTEIFITVCAMKMRRRGVFDRGTTWFCARCLLAAGAMAAAVFLLRDGGLFVKVGVGAVVYGLASLAVGNVSVAAVKGSLDSVRRAGAGEQLTDVSGPAETAEPMGKS